MISATTGLSGSPPGPDAGFTLVELLVAVLLAAFIVLAVGAQTLTSVRTGIRNESQSIGITLAEDRIECIRWQYEAAQALTGTCTNAIPVPPEFTVTPVVVQDVGGTGRMEVTVTVTWTGDPPGEVVVTSVVNT